MTNLPDSRPEAVGRLACHLARFGSPRVQLFSILLLTGTVGAVLSFVLLQLVLERGPDR